MLLILRFIAITVT